MANGVINLVIMGAPRSGTTYMATILNACGLRTFHQHYFTPENTRPPVRCDGAFAEVSPAAYLLRHAIPRRTRIIHQTRHPVANINSLIHTQHCKWSNNNLPANPWDRAYAKALRSTTVQWDATRVGRCKQFWCMLNEGMKHYTQQRNGFTYHVEDVNEQLIERIFELTGEKFNRQRVQYVLENTRKNINQLGKEPSEHIVWDNLTRNQKVCAARMGYQSA